MKAFVSLSMFSIFFVGGLLLLTLTNVSAGAGEARPFITYSQTGGEMNMYGNIRLEVYWSGLTRIEQLNPRNRTYEYTLLPTHISALSNVIESVRFFDLPESTSARSPMLPKCELTAEVGGRSRTVHFTPIEGFRPLHQELCRLMDQGLIMSDIQGSRLNLLTLSRLAWNDVDIPRPDLIVPILKNWADHYGDVKVVENAFSALARLTPPDEWVAFATNQVRTANEHHRAALLSLYASRHLHYSLSTNYVRALLPYMTRVVESYASPNIVIEEATDSLLMQIIVFIQGMHHQEAVPALRKLAEAHPDPNARAARMAENAAKRLAEPPSVSRK